uniref:Bm16934 n=1 Tax=Brugia malayi TaxID=6279 RepID=A0A7I4K7G9_BRUMA
MQKSEKLNDGKNANLAQTSAKSAKVGMDLRASENDPCKQVFANRSVYLQKIRYYGFDMDFTLAIYKSPEYDILLYSNIINRLILLGYPEQLRCFPYEQDFVIRGLWFDRTFGNLLKVDGFGNILVGIHGYNYLRRTSDGTGVRNGDTIISYKSLAEDVLSAVNYVHNDGVLSYLIGSDWTSYFDVSIVDAKKPLWFMKGTVFRQIDTETGTPKIGVHQGLLKKGDVYAGGNSDDFRRLFNARDREVLYIGDHIFGDVLKSKKTKGWRTFLVIPELVKEISIWSQRHDLFEKVVELTKQVEAMYNQINITSAQSIIQEGNIQIRERTQEMDNYYSKMGSLFRSGPRTTFFASQVERFADLYSSSCYNLLYYPLFYFFRAPMTLMPHEVNADKCIREKKASLASSGTSRRKNFHSGKDIETIPHVQDDTAATTEEEILNEVNSDEQTSSESQ